ncbi:MAG: pantoate--beta-alanine ligase [Armatimonadota bacterium]
MEVITDPKAMQEACALARMSGMSIGFVPTMGYLHEGHLSLIRAARADCDTVVLSIFVNPTQFGPHEDYHRYPRDPERDLELARSTNVNLVFMPTPDAMYPHGYSTFVEVEGLTDKLEGAFRPGHFRGVATVVLKLFNIVQPHRAYFGQKDYQQLLVIRRMVGDLNLPIEIVAMPTVREPDGLAMSSRNTYLSPEQRRAALAIPRALERCREVLQSGERKAWVVTRAGTEVMDAEPLLKLDYLTVADPDTLAEPDIVGTSAVVLVAARCGSTRLIDNVIWEESA